MCLAISLDFCPPPARQRDLFPLPFFGDFLDSPGTGFSSSAKRRSLQRDHIGKWREEIGGVLNEMCGGHHTMHAGRASLSQTLVMGHVSESVRSLGSPPSDADGRRVTGRAALHELLAKQGYGGGATVDLDINLLSLPSVDYVPVALPTLMGPGGNSFIRSLSAQRSSQRWLLGRRLRTVVSRLLTWIRPCAVTRSGMADFWSGCGLRA